MLQPAVKREKTFAKTTIICIARSSSPQGDDLLHKQKLKKCDDTLHDFVVTILPALEASTYLHVELIVPSNADFSIQGDTVFRQLRDSIITATSAGPVQLVMSSKDGLTINAPGFAKWLKTLPAKIRLANPRLFVSRLDGLDPHHDIAVRNSAVPPTLDGPVIKSLTTHPIALSFDQNPLILIIDKDDVHPFFGQKRNASG